MVVQTKKDREFTAMISISGKGFKVYCPVHTVEVRHARKREEKQRPLFPRYIFVSTDHDGLEVGAINYADGVADRGLFCIPGTWKPCTMPDSVIQGVRKREFDMAVTAGEMTSGFKPGDKFIVPVGPFASIEAAYVGEDKGTIYALVEMFGKGHKVEFPVSALPNMNRSAA